MNYYTAVVRFHRKTRDGPITQKQLKIDFERCYGTSSGYRPSDKGGSGHPDPEIAAEGRGLKKNFFRSFGPQFGLKIRGDRPPGPSPGSVTGYILFVKHSLRRRPNLTSMN